MAASRAMLARCCTNNHVPSTTDGRLVTSPARSNRRRRRPPARFEERAIPLREPARAPDLRELRPTPQRVGGPSQAPPLRGGLGEPRAQLVLPGHVLAPPAEVDQAAINESWARPGRLASPVGVLRATTSRPRIIASRAGAAPGSSSGHSSARGRSERVPSRVTRSSEIRRAAARSTADSAPMTASACRASAPATPPISSRAAAGMRAPSTSRRDQSSASAKDRSGSAPGASITEDARVSTIASLSNRTPLARAGHTTASRASARLSTRSRCKLRATTGASAGSAATRVRKSPRTATTTLMPGMPRAIATITSAATSASAAWLSVTSSSN